MSEVAAQAAAGPIRYSIVILTYARDEPLVVTLDHLHAAMGERADTEVILVDNNVDTVDRMRLLSKFSAVQWVRTGRNSGVSARNDGMAVAKGDIIILLDDDVLVETPDFLSRFEAAFAVDPAIGVVNARKLDAATLDLPAEFIPHTRKSVDVTRPFMTFRFVGGLVALRRQVFERLGGFSPEFFYGLEEREYSYRIIQDGWKIYYTPDIVALETTAPGGRKSRVDQRTDTLTNRYIISYIHMPLLPMIGNFVLFTFFLMVKERGGVNIVEALRRFRAWLSQPGRSQRKPLSPAAQAYVRACGGELWR